jgi:beta-N-acetylhexosaminidase
LRAVRIHREESLREDLTAIVVIPPGVDNSPVIGDRSYGDTPEKVAKHGIAFARGLILGGALPCAKHFPGHGDASLDSHISLPRVNHNMERLRQIEIEPFKEWVKSDLGPVMTAHVVYPALDPENPATSSRLIVAGELRQRLGHKGVVFSDDLEMGAVEELGGTLKIASRAVRAGVDGLLICKNSDLQLGTWEELISMAEQIPDFYMAIDSAAARINSISIKRQSETNFDWIGSNEHLNRKLTLFDRIGEELR